MKATRKYREKYTPRFRLTDDDKIVLGTYTPAGSKDVMKLCDAVDGLKQLIEDAIHYIDNPVLANRTSDRMNMILIRLEEK